MAIDLHVYATAIKKFFVDTAAEIPNEVDKAFQDNNENNIIDRTRANVRRNNYSSIAAKATEGILQFPVLVSNSIDYEDAVIIMKACERAYAGFIQVIFSMNADMVDVGANNMSEFIRRFHQNDGITSVDTDADNLSKAMRLSNESASLEDELFIVNCSAVQPSAPIMGAALKEAMKPYIDNFNMTKLNDVYSPRRISQVGTTIDMEDARGQEPKLRKHHHIVKEANVVLSSGDVKKANELQPTFINLELQRGNAKQPVTYHVTLGIKCTLHVIPSDEFISNLVNACEYKGKLFRFIKWTTGEINFIRDFVLNLDVFKKTTKSRAGVNSHWWDALKRRATDAKISKLETTRMLPNTTLVLTREEADEIKANFGYDVMNPSVASRIMKEYFLLGFVVLSASEEIAHVLYDGQKSFQTYTLKALERENSNTERTLKELLKNR